MKQTDHAPLSTHDSLLIVDFGSQVTQLIARRLREANIYCEIHPFHNVTADSIRAMVPKAVILSGGPASVMDEDSPRAPDELYTMGLPILGICYGQQVMMQQLGGLVEGHGHSEFGRAYVEPTGEKLQLLDGWFDNGAEQVWMSHGDTVTKLAAGFTPYGASPNAPYAITADTERQFYAVQFHPEVHHTPMGAKLLRNFTEMAGFVG
ncbi:MAG: glutamine-hydrolyzing GMP synthase, partial [Pikeienuella sp.]